MGFSERTPFLKDPFSELKLMFIKELEDAAAILEMSSFFWARVSAARF